MLPYTITVLRRITFKAITFVKVMCVFHSHSRLKYVCFVCRLVRNKRMNEKKLEVAIMMLPLFSEVHVIHAVTASNTAVTCSIPLIN